MNIDFHYYVIHYLCNLSGFSEKDAHTVAYASQFVDHNILAYHIKTPRELYYSIPTQNYGFWDEYFPKEVYIPFHFFPGDPSKARDLREDGRENRLCCTQNSPRVKQLLIKALKSRDLFRIGIALHTFADSWAHQNFSGLVEDWNRLDQRSLVPAIGHAQAFRKPDQPLLVWEDRRLVRRQRRVYNRDRVIKAARQIYKYLRTYHKLDFKDVDLVQWQLDKLLGDQDSEKSSDERISDFIIQENMMKYDRSEWLEEAFELRENPGDDRLFTGYDKLLWLRDAMLYRSSLVVQKPVQALEGFYDSHFYRFQHAAREHKIAAASILSDLKII